MPKEMAPFQDSKELLQPSKLPGGTHFRQSYSKWFTSKRMSQHVTERPRGCLFPKSGDGISTHYPNVEKIRLRKCMASLTFVMQG